MGRNAGVLHDSATFILGWPVCVDDLEIDQVQCYLD